jgi:thiol:disulfide interchange protein
MRLRRTLALIALTGAAILATSCGAPPPAEPVSTATWTKDLDAAKAEAKKTGKLIMVDFNATWCGPCQEYKKEVFPTAEFAAAAKDFVLVEIDIDEQPKLAQQYNIEGIPDIRMLDSKGAPVGRIMGYAGSEGLLAEMKRARDKS